MATIKRTRYVISLSNGMTVNQAFESYTEALIYAFNDLQLSCDDFEVELM